MDRFTDDRTLVVFESGFAKGVPKHVAHEAGWKMQVLVCAAEIGDVSILGPINRWVETGRLGVHIEGKWFVTFEWVAGLGATQLTLERR